jgi:hypothetical protein
MMKWTILFLTLVLSFNVFSQNKIQINLGMSYPAVVDGSDDVLYEYWKTGINTGVAAHIKILAALNFQPNISYQYLFFHKYYQYVSYGPGPVNSTASGSHVVKFGGELHLGDGEENRTRFSIFVGGGYAMERPGTMAITWTDDLYRSSWQLPTRNYWYGSAGINLEFSLTKHLSIGTSVKYFRNKAESISLYASDNTIWLVNCSMLYDIMLF